MYGIVTFPFTNRNLVHRIDPKDPVGILSVAY